MATGNRRAPKNDGTIYYDKTHDRWHAQVTLENGKRKSLYGKTAEEVREKKTAMVRDRDRGMVIADGQQTVKQYLAYWLETKRAEGLEPRTITFYQTQIERRIVPVLGKTRLDKLTPQQVQGMLNRAGDQVGQMTVLHTFRTLRAALQDAFREGSVARNVCGLIRTPRTPHHEMLVWTPEQAARFREQVRGDRHEALYTLALATGMRQGELLGLRWQDVDLDCGAVQVERNMQRERRHAPAPDEPLTAMRSKRPKTAAGRRRIDIEAGVIEALREHRRAQLEARLAAGERWHARDLVFCSRFGGPLNKSNIDPQFHRLSREAGVPLIRFHDMRHTAATLMLLRLIQPHVVSKMLGHSSVAITLRLYGHVLQVQQREAASVMDAILHGEQTTNRATK